MANDGRSNNFFCIALSSIECTEGYITERKDRWTLDNQRDGQHYDLMETLLGKIG